MSHFTLFATASIIICIPMSRSKFIAIEIPNLAGYKSSVSIAYLSKRQLLILLMFKQVLVQTNTSENELLKNDIGPLCK